MPAAPAVPIPTAFLERMQTFLGSEYPAFAEALNHTPTSGVRVNTLKVTPDQFKEISPFPLGEGVPWCPSAFYLDGEDRPGKHPYHLAGMYYLQDPSAMSPAELLAPKPGESVLDLAAAPGGKTTHLAALMQGNGLLVANEIKNKRLGHLAQNVERWGAGNIVITNETPERLGDHFGAFFDRVLVDAPCSGEGMFRKDMGSRADWSTEMIDGCAVRQGNILQLAGKLVRPGGHLMYSTCTFAPEEDEAVIDRFLEEFTDFQVITLPQFPGFTGGKPEWLELISGKNKKGSGIKQSLEGAVRLFPHRLTGEGHFACLLHRSENGDQETIGIDHLDHPTKSQVELWKAFAEDGLNVDLPAERLRVVGERLYYVPDLLPDLGRLRAVHPGVWIGSLKKDRFEPAHPLALFLKSGEAAQKLDLGSEIEPGRRSPLQVFLSGESLPSEGRPGWTLVCVDGWPLGWGKRVQGILKNHYPRGWIIK